MSILQKEDESVTSTTERLSDLSIKSSDNKARENYIDWDEFFMAAAYLCAQRSKDPNTQVGACIVNEDNKIVGMGYNGMPNGCHDSQFPWGKVGDDLDTKYLYVCHAEMNAVLNSNSINLKNCRIYTALFPCNECAKIIIQSGIKEVIYMSDKNKHKKEYMASIKMFDAVGIKYWQFKPSKESITINFYSIK